MAKSLSYPPDKQFQVLAKRIARIAKVPSHEQDEFCERLRQTVWKVRKRDRRLVGAQIGGRLIEAAEAARHLCENISHMNEQDRGWVEHMKKSQMQFENGRVDDLATATLNIAMVLHAALGKSYVPPDKLGLGSRRIEDQMLHELVFGLLSAVRETRGRLTFDKNAVSGTLAQALDLLRPYVPEGLLPEPLPASTIQRLRTNHRLLGA